MRGPSVHAWLVAAVVGGAHFFASSAGAQAIIDRDARYVAAYVDKTTDGSDPVLIIESTVDSWKKEIRGSQGAAFTPDGKSILFMEGGALCILALGTDRQTRISNVKSYQQPEFGTGEWLAYQTGNDAGTEVVLRNVRTGNEQRFKGVTQYRFSDRGTALVLVSGGRQGASSGSAIQWVSLPEGEAHTVWSDEAALAVGFEFDADGQRLAFKVQEKTADRLANMIWYYKVGSERAELLVDDRTRGVDDGLVVGDDPVRFSPKGGRLFFKLQEKELPSRNPKLANVDVWSYLDAKVQSQQLKDLQPRQYAAVVSVEDRRITRLERENEIVAGTAQFDDLDGAQETDDFALIIHFDADVLTYAEIGDDKVGSVVSVYSLSQRTWNKASLASIDLLSLSDGSRTPLRTQIKPLSSDFPYFRLSPQGRYVVYFDPAKDAYLSYEIATGMTRNIVRGSKVSWRRGGQETRGDLVPNSYYGPWSIEGWLEGDEGVLLRDHYSDTWRADPSGQRQPVNLTNGFARRHHVVLEPLPPYRRVFRDTDRVLLGAEVDVNSRRYMNAGIYSKALSARSDPDELVRTGGSDRVSRVQKAADAEVYLLSRENSREPPSEYYTRDFHTFTPITSSQPEQRRAVEQELITWRTLDGSLSQGSLFKPLGFDPRKKYPIIFYYYEQHPTPLDFNTFRVARHGDFTNDGYLIFLPDIHYRLGAPGPSAHSSVVSAAKYLAKFPFVDGHRMGIAGGSWGGYETNYLVTHSDLFAAAYSACGVTDYFSYYGTEEKDRSGASSTAFAETGQNRLGVTPWERPDLYIKNSPIFTADRVTTPLLIVHDANDYRVPFGQSVELFKALRRLGKRAWLLQYGKGHEGAVPIFGISGIEDLDIRFKQFFDHYLKGAPAPRWMTRGVPARMKGVDSGLELDTEIETPPTRGLLMDEQVRTPEQLQLLTRRVVRHPKSPAKSTNAR